MPGSPGFSACSRLCLLAVPMLLAGPLCAANLELVQTLPLLGGRLSLKVPKGAEYDARPPDSIMSAAQSSETETRITFKLDPGKLVIFLEETYALAPPASHEKLLAYLRAEKPDAKPSTFIVYKTRIFLQGPTQWAEVVKGGELAEAALIVLPDETVVKAGFFVSPDAKNKEQLRALARESLRTLAPGRPLETGGKIAVSGIEVNLPKGWVYSSQKGPDFRVHHFSKIAVWGTDASSIGIYSGRHASYQHNQVEGAQALFTRQKGKWLERDVTWHVSGSEPKLRREAILRLDGGSVRHVWHSANPETNGIVDAMKSVQR